MFQRATVILFSSFSSLLLDHPSFDPSFLFSKAFTHSPCQPTPNERMSEADSDLRRRGSESTAARLPSTLSLSSSSSSSPPSSSSFVALPAARRTHSFTRSVAGFGVAPNFDSTENSSEVRATNAAEQLDGTTINIESLIAGRDGERGRRWKWSLRPSIRPSIAWAHMNIKYKCVNSKQAKLELNAEFRSCLPRLSMG